MTVLVSPDGNIEIPTNHPAEIVRLKGQGFTVKPQETSENANEPTAEPEKASEPPAEATKPVTKPVTAPAKSSK